MFESLVQSPLGDVLLVVGLEDQNFLGLGANGTQGRVTVEGKALDAGTNAVFSFLH